MCDGTFETRAYVSHYRPFLRLRPFQTFIDSPHSYPRPVFRSFITIVRKNMPLHNLPNEDNDSDSCSEADNGSTIYSQVFSNIVIGGNGQENQHFGLIVDGSGGVTSQAVGANTRTVLAAHRRAPGRVSPYAPHKSRARTARPSCTTEVTEVSFQANPSTGRRSFWNDDSDDGENGTFRTGMTINGGSGGNVHGQGGMITFSGSGNDFVFRGPPYLDRKQIASGNGQEVQSGEVIHASTGEQRAGNTSGLSWSNHDHCPPAIYVGL